MNVKIRKWELDDAQDLVIAINNKKVQDNLRDGIPFPYTLSDAQMFISSILSAEKDSQYVWAITVDNKAIGCIGVYRKDNIHKYTAEMGYYIAEPWWGRGIATAAVKEACDYIFGNTDIIRIFATPFANNIASCRVLEKAGFVLEGTLRKNAVKNGEVLDMKMYAQIKE
ncbi:MAG TPA: GNAT family N-acetyltransferase [Clostridiaceae bacterium]|nr:GNAT family N-acetyltransferase [Clostridiaceae bacterium]